MKFLLFLKIIQCLRRILYNFFLNNCVLLEYFINAGIENHELLKIFRIIEILQRLLLLLIKILGTSDKNFIKIFENNFIIYNDN